MIFDVSADIIPAKSLGGLLLRTPLIDLQDDVMDYWISKLPEGSYYLGGIFEARYPVADGAIEICVDVRNGKVFKICAMPGYTGKLFSKLTVGMTVKDAMSIEPRLYYDEPEEVLMIRGVEGVSLDVPEIDPDPIDVPSMSISAICVNIAELMTRSGQQGTW